MLQSHFCKDFILLWHSCKSETWGIDRHTWLSMRRFPHHHYNSHFSLYMHIYVHMLYEYTNIQYALNMLTLNMLTTTKIIVSWIILLRLDHLLYNKESDCICIESNTHKPNKHICSHVKDFDQISITTCPYWNVAAAFMSTNLDKKQGHETHAQHEHGAATNHYDVGFSSTTMIHLQEIILHVCTLPNGQNMSYHQWTEENKISMDLNYILIIISC